MNTLKDRNFNPDHLEGEFNLIKMWANPTPGRIQAGVLAGVFAGILMILFGVFYCASQGMDLLLPIKISALPFLGNAATAYGSVKGVMVGGLAFLVLSSVLGATYALFTGVNNKIALFGMGFTWGAYGWIFISCLMMQSFHDYKAANIPLGVMFFAWMVFGMGLTSVAFFDKRPTK